MPLRNCWRRTASACKLFCQIRRPAFLSWTCRCRSGANLTLPHVGTLEGICTARQDSPVRGGEPGSDRLPAGRARLSAAPAPLRALTPRHALWSRAISVLSRETDRALRLLPHEERQRLEGRAPVGRGEGEPHDPSRPDRDPRTDLLRLWEGPRRVFLVVRRPPAQSVVAALPPAG